MLGNKGFGVVLRIGAGVLAGVGEEAAIAHMPPAAYAYPMHADAALRLGDGDDVYVLLFAVLVLAVYELFGLHHGEGLDLVAQLGSAFKV